MRILEYKTTQNSLLIVLKFPKNIKGVKMRKFYGRNNYRRGKAKGIYTPKGLENKIKLWVLRGIESYNLYDNLDRRSDDLVKFLGLENYVDKKNDENTELKIKISQEIARLEKLKMRGNALLNKNLSKIADMLSLSECERDILEFFILNDTVYPLNAITSSIEVNPIGFYGDIAKVTGLSYDECKKALNQKSSLIKSGILKLRISRCEQLKYVANFCDDSFTVNIINLKNPSADELFGGIWRKCDDGELDTSDFEHLAISPARIIEYIKSANKGLNILLYGKAGVGKTEFCKAVARAINKDLYEVAFVDEDGDSASSTERLRALRLSNAMLNSKNSIILFDEIEDVFRRRNVSKAYINRTLEENKVPTFWLTNDVCSMDDAYIRRFDMAIEFKIPPKARRKELIASYTKGTLNEKTINKLAKNKAIAPALISSASKVLNTLKVADEKERNKLFTKLIDGNLNAQGKLRFTSAKKSKKTKGVELPDSYDICYINTSADLKEIAKGIKEQSNARICIYGVPGTGKSAYAKYIAKELGCEIIIKKGSDLIDCYVGNTEKNIAEAFKEAKDKKAVLCFDEVDGFLLDRTSAIRSWEINRVNEMLVQMESFEGVFIATTNLCDSLDKASLRRFDLKLEFGYLKSEQACELFKKECELLGLEVSKTALSLVGSLRTLTPGDFATIKRANRFCHIKGSDDFATRLKSEVALKNAESGNKLGFVG